eukprot:CAMPEP_0196820638 /NCGR_PEP_ID=MMETSP1362-20130617/76179_1 /TAXON_ID=163516 /ORGANISM="Leptocylindrus danicus, Strain CCMP1856" /LENGTH=257 /DNA_ID=CAMNT_0042199601 /DNA_START=410 /DNA_END=1180 /DNA_ORIENTATION=-
MDLKSNTTTFNNDIENASKTIEVESNSSEQGSDISTWSRFKYELTSDDLLEEPDGSIVDVELAFAPEPARRTALIRGALMSFNLGIWVWDMIMGPADEYYMIYLTNWTIFFSIAYLIASFLCAALPRSEVFEDNNTKEVQRPRLIAKIAWELYAMIAPAGLTVVLMYWVAIYDGRTIIFLNLWRHGILALCVILDGLFIGSVPIRIKQMRNIIVYEFLFLVWSIVHIFAGIGNGKGKNENDDEEEENDDAIYGVLNW